MKHFIPDKSFSLFFNTISSLIEMNDGETDYYSSLLTVSHYQKGEVMLNAGNICKNIFFLNKGICRTYFLNAKGEERTFHFTLEGGFITDYESFHNQQPAYFSIQALEPVDAVVMSYNAVDQGYKYLKHGEKLGRLLAEKYLFIFTNKIKSIYTEDALERYKKMNQTYPNIIQRIPQHYIASYLNITPVHLSRLKAENKE